MTVFMNPTVHRGRHGLPHDQTSPHRMAGPWDCCRFTFPCHRLAELEPVIEYLKVQNLAELVHALSLSSGRLSRNEAAAVLSAMLRGAQVDPLVPRAIIEALIPGVLALSGRFDVANGPWCDLDAFYTEAVSALWELTNRWAGTDRPYAAGDL